MSRPEHFVDLGELVADAVVDVRYATADNFTGAPLPGYDRPLVWCDAVFAERVVAAAAALRAEGLGLVLFDGYRPVRAARAMADWCRRTGNEWILDGYVSASSRHCKGTAVDVTLFRLDTGERLDMGTDFDAFGEPGHTRNATGEALANRLRLRDAMMAAGCEDYRREWWHFDAPDLDRPLLDVPIC